MALKYSSIVNRTFRLCHKLGVNSSYNKSQTLYFCTNKEISENEAKDSKTKLSGFAAAFERQSKLDEVPVEPEETDKQTFASLLRNSKFVDLGDPNGKIVVGTIYHVVEDDLYIDFGWKFPTICGRPATNKESYVLGTKVRLRINDLELSTRFLGSTTDITLKEADCTLLGLYRKNE